MRNSQFIKDSEKELEGHLKRFIWLGYSPSDPTSVDEAYKRATTWRTQSAALDAQQLDNQKQIEREQAAETQCRNLLHGIKEELSQKKGKLETLQSTLQAGVLDGYRGWSMKDLGVESNRLKLLYVAIEKEYLGTQEKAGLILSTMDGLKGHLGSLESLLLSQREEANGLEKALEQALVKSGFVDLETVEGILKLTMDVEVERKKISEYRIERTSVENQYSLLEKELAGVRYDSEYHASLLEALGQFEQELQGLNQKRGGLATGIIQMKQRIADSARLKGELEVLGLRGDNIKTLKAMFREKGFVDYVSSLYLQELCRAADDRFRKLTREQLRLQLHSDNSFKVIDVLNGGKERHIKTLSGGQTFQAALCLALALADSVQPRIQSKQNFFFLDEGFGSLDKESLATVFETLKSLRKEDRVVGVISHVEEMQQEMERYLKVTNGEGGSRIEMI